MIGRESELSALVELVAGERLVTLVGVGGIGKTRLAAAVCSDVASGFPGGVWWVDFATTTDAALVGEAVLGAVGSRDIQGSVVERQVVAALGDRSALLVLDNCEHVLAAASRLVQSLLATSASISVLATTREPLGLAAEVAWRVAPLACGDADDGSTLGLDRPAAVELFVERARRARPTLELSKAELARVDHICARLDGIPLAIELAAARCRQFSIDRIAEGLDDRFRFLSDGRSAVPRHRTLAASLEWSCARLDQSEALAFRRLAVFIGTFPIEAAVSVIGSASIGKAEAVDLVGRLVDKSLVVAEPAADGSMRYRMLETVRAYALDEADARELDLAREAHIAFWLEWLEPIAVMPTDTLLAQVAAYEGNLRAALEWAARDPSRGLRLLARLARVWTALGRANSLLNAADILLAPDNETRHPDAWIPAAIEAAPVYLVGRGITACIELAERIDEVVSRIGDDHYRLLGNILVYDNPADLAAVRDAARTRGDRYRATVATLALAEWMADADPAAAAPFLEQAASAVATGGNAALRVLDRVNVITAARARGDLRRCIELARAELAGAEMATHDQQLVIELSAAGLLARDVDALKAAAAEADAVEWVAPGVAGWANRARHRLALFEGAPSRVDEEVLMSVVGWPISTASMWLLGREAIDAGQREPVADWARQVVEPHPHSRAVLAAIEGAAADDEDRWHAALSLAVAHHLPLIAVDAFENLAAIAVQAESWQEGGRLIGAAARLRDETGYRWRFAAEQQRVDDALSAIREALGDAADVCATEGGDRTWHETAEYASRARGERRRPRHGWLSLTPTELRVVELVAEGCTNPQIADRLMMGRATVKTHLDHVYAKVGVSGRSQLAAEFARRASKGV